MGHLLRMEENRTVRNILLSSVKPTLESIFEDASDSNITKATLYTKHRVTRRN